MIRFKDHIQIIKDVVLILSLIIGIPKACSLADEQKELIGERKDEVQERLRAQQLAQIDKLSKDIHELDVKLETRSAWKGSLTWEQLESVRKMKREEMIRLESAIGRSAHPIENKEQ